MKTFSKFVLFATGLASATASFVLAADTTAPTPATPPAASDAKPRHHAGLKALHQRRQLAARALGRRLDLTGEQKTQLKSLRQKTAADLRGIRRDSTLSPDQKKAKLHELRQGVRAQASGVLTPEQKTKAAKLRHHRRHQLNRAAVK